MRYEEINRGTNDLTKSFAYRAEMARKKRVAKVKEKIIEVVLTILVSLGITLAFIFAIANDDCSDMPTANPAYISEYETPDVPRYIYPGE